MTNACCACAHFPESCNGTQGCKPKTDKPTIKELEPCPFHKERIEPNIFQGFDQGNGNPGSGGFWATVECSDCGNGFTAMECANPEDALELALGQWNTRYKRTCHFVNNRNNRGSWPDCSVCGEAIQRGNRFCGHCGAEVQDD